MLTIIKHVADDNYVFNMTAHWHIMPATVKLHGSELSTSLILIMAFR